MAYAFKLGPIETAEGSAHVFVGVDERGPQLFEGGNDVAGIENVRRWAKGPLTCDVSLTAAAEKLGLPVAPLPQELQVLRMAVAVLVEHGPQLAKLPPTALLELIQAAFVLYEAAPWEAFDEEPYFDAELKGRRARRLEGALMGWGGEQRGLALYDTPGSIERLTLGGDPLAFDALSLLIDDEPAFVADAIEAVTGSRFVPKVMRLKGGRPRPPDLDDIMALAACARAAAQLGEADHGLGVSEVDDRRVTAFVRLWPDDEELEVDEQQALDFSRVGRNEPCPCGSGKKFKKCHGDGSGTTAGPAPSELHDFNAGLVRRILAYGEKRFGRDRIQKAQDEAKSARGDTAVAAQWSLPYLAYVHPFDGKPLSQWFAAEEDGSLSARERRWLDAQAEARLTIWEVLSVDPKKGMLTVVDLLGEERADVHDWRATKVLKSRHAVLARVARFESEAIFTCFDPLPLPPWSSQRVFAAARSGEVSSRRLLELWRAEAERLEQPAQGKVTNTDGDPVVFVEDHYRFEPDRRDRVLGALLGIDGASLQVDERNEARLSLSRSGNSMHASWRATLIASVVVKKRELVVQTNSLARADDVRGRIDAALAGLIAHVRRDEGRIEVPSGIGEDFTIDAQAVPRALAQIDPFQRLARREWVVTPMERLDGLTPEQAAAREELRQRVHWMLKEVEFRSGHGQAENDLPPDWERRHLGLDEVGRLRAGFEKDRALGAGAKASETLLDFAVPLLEELEGVSPEEVRPALDFAAMVWNAVVDEDNGGALGKGIAQTRRELASAAPSRTLEQFDALIARKKRLFAHERRYFAVRDISARAGRVSFSVEARVVRPTGGKLPERQRVEGR